MLHLALLAITVAPLARSHAVLFEQEGMIASLYVVPLASVLGESPCTLPRTDRLGRCPD